MINKIYENIKKIIKENKTFLIVLLFTTIILNIPLPYYIYAPGGIKNVQDNLKIEESYKSKGSFNMVYIKEYKGSLSTLILAKLKNYQIEKIDKKDYRKITKEDYLSNKIFLNAANYNALKIALEYANKEYTVKDKKIYTTYILNDKTTNLKVGDIVTKVNNKDVYNFYDLSNALEKNKEIQEFEIITNNKEKNIKTASYYDYEGYKVLGIVFYEVGKINTYKKIEINFDKNESGPSAGLITALAIYNSLVKEDITKGMKIVGTGTIEIDGSVGSIGGIEYKLEAAIKNNADIFLVPNGENYDKVMNLIKENNYNIKVYGVSSFEDALDLLK